MSYQQISQATNAQDTQPEHLYEYESLPEGPFTRYLSLHPASIDTDPLGFTLHTARLDEIPPFEAISYVWGMPVYSRAVSCNDKITYITANLYDVLHQVRLTDKPRTLWADLICINQKDRKERGQQVSIMGNIYKKSNCTLICLGMSDHLHAQAVSDLVADIDCMAQKVFEEANFDWDFNGFPFAKIGEPLLSHRGWDSFGVLLQQPWFKRGWVVQEAIVSQSTLMLWANTEIAWLKLLQVYVWYTRRALCLPNTQHIWLSELHLQGFYTYRVREAITSGPEGALGPLTLLEILDSARRLGVADPRDRIYAVLNLPSSNKLVPTLQPNYEIPYFHVYRDFACEYLRISQDLDILHFVQNDDDTLDSNSTSWIPRWNMNLYFSYTGAHKNYSNSSSRIISSLSPYKIVVSRDQSTLKVRMAIIGTVKFTGPGFDKNTTTPDDVASLWESASTVHIQLPAYSCSPLRAFVEIFRCGAYRGRLDEWKLLDSAYMRLLQHELSPGHAQYDSAKRFHKMRMEDVHNESFVVLDRGYYGLVPNIVREGDICCIIFGTRSPFILRKTGQDRHYKLVGSALIIGKELDHNGYPKSICGGQDLTEWDLEEEDIVLC